MKFTVIMPKPDPVNAKNLDKKAKFVWRGSLRVGSVALGVVSVPTLIDMFGLGGGSVGPPGFAFLEPSSETAEEDYLFMLVAPDIEFAATSADVAAVAKGSMLGAIAYAGRLFGVVYEHGKKEDIDAFIKDVNKGADDGTSVVVLDTIRYKHPDLSAQGLTSPLVSL